MLRDEALPLHEIGTFLERADGVARLLLIRLACEAASPSRRGRPRLLPVERAAARLSAFEIFRRVSRDSVSPRHVMEFVILHRGVPRSIYRSLNLVAENVDAVANAQSGETERRAGLLHAELRFGTLASLAPEGCERFLRTCWRAPPT